MPPCAVPPPFAGAVLHWKNTMTVSTATSKSQYNGNGSTTVFSTGFAFTLNTDVVVILRNLVGVDVTWVESTQYTLTGAGTGSNGTVTVITSPTDFTPASGEILTITREPPETQETDYPAGGAFPAQSTEDALDKVTHLVQAHSEELGRTFRAPVTDVAVTFELPSSDDRASKAFQFDSLGNPIMVEPTDASGTSVTATGSSQARILADRFADSINSKDYGVPNDGLSSAVSALEAFFVAGIAADKAMVIHEGDYLIDSEMTPAIAAGKQFQLYGIGRVRFIQDGPDGIIKISDKNSGWVTTEGNTLDSDAAVGDITLTLTAGKGANFTEDTWVVLISDDTAFVGNTTALSAEFVFIESIATDVLTLAAPIRFAHTTADTAEVNRVLWTENLVIDNIEFIGADDDLVSALNSYNALELNWCFAPKITNIKGSNFTNLFLSLLGCKDTLVRDFRATDQLSKDIEGRGFGYSIVELNLNEGGIFTNIHTERTRHAYTTASNFGNYGVAIGSRIGPGVATQMRGSGWDTHPDGLNISFVNCVVIGSQGSGFQVRSVNTTISGWHAQDCIAAALLISVDAEDTIEEGGRYTNTNLGSFSGVDFTLEPRVKDSGARTVRRAEFLIKKKSNQTVTSSTTVVIDTNLVYLIHAEEEITFEVSLIYTSSAAGDLRFTFTVPTGSSIAWSTANGLAPDAGDTVVLFTGVTVSGTERVVGGGPSIRNLFLTGSVKCGQTPGEFRLRWAQGTLDATGTTIRARSYMRINQV